MITDAKWEFRRKRVFCSFVALCIAAYGVISIVTRRSFLVFAGYSSGDAFVAVSKITAIFAGLAYIGGSLIFGSYFCLPFSRFFRFEEISRKIGIHLLIWGLIAAYLSFFQTHNQPPEEETPSAEVPSHGQIWLTDFASFE